MSARERETLTILIRAVKLDPTQRERMSIREKESIDWVKKRISHTMIDKNISHMEWQKSHTRWMTKMMNALSDKTLWHIEWHEPWLTCWDMMIKRHEFLTHGVIRITHTFFDTNPWHIEWQRALSNTNKRRGPHIDSQKSLTHWVTRISHTWSNKEPYQIRIDEDDHTLHDKTLSHIERH